MHLEAAATMIGLELDIYREPACCESSLATHQLSEKTGADPRLLNRVLRYLAATGSIDEASQGHFSANNVTKNLSKDLVVAGMRHSFYTIGPQYQVLPSFLKTTGFIEPRDELHTAFQEAWHTPLDAFSWFANQPDHLAYFNEFMALRREPKLSWLSVYPVREVTGQLDRDQAVYVNIGGGIGHQCVQFKEKFPHVPGRVILQDLPHTITKALPCEGVEYMAYDFYEPQPVIGAKFYFMRGVLHDHPSHLVGKILENTRAAMREGSVLLVDEMILPETKVSARVAAIDLTMLAARGGMERTQSQWRETLVLVGLKLLKTYLYNPANYESVMEVRLPQDTGP
ncbi:S-adenosyl-L-methionine-dependent methyltransferase [Xylaria sp. FL1777]|nr:S-adenosyl-L-methionine-dependent methyltransferase [Xylaria sp. FL1777]